MVISQETTSLVSSLQNFSREKLHHPEDLASLIELSRLHRHDQVLDDLTFIAKFLVNTSAIMTRIGKNGEGYEKLAHEFAENLEKALTFVRLLVKEAPDDVKRRFTTGYFEMAPEAMERLMQLLHDISWLKNWNIDHRSTAQ
jgi:hypothetical protein